MKFGHPRTALLVAVLVAGAPFALGGVANATGTARIQYQDGKTKTYTNVRIVVLNESLAMTSSDGQGTLVLGKAACMKDDELMRCLPYDATLFQAGRRTHIALQSGTVWFNPSATKQQLSHSSTQLPPRGILLLITTKKGTYVTLSGVVDEIQKK